MAAVERKVEFLECRLDELIDQLKQSDSNRVTLLQEIRSIELEIKNLSGTPRLLDWLLDTPPNRYDIALMVLAAVFTLGTVVGMALKWL